MLKGMSKLFTGDLLKALCDMGHGDKIAIVDANFPAYTTGKRVLSFQGSSATDLLGLILPFFPLDHIESEPVLLMDITKEDQALLDKPDIWEEFTDMVHREYGEDKRIGKLSRNEFYEVSKDCYLIIQSGEERLYGNNILVKGVI